MSRFKIYLGWLCFFLFILTFSIFVTINFMPLYRFDIGYLHILDISPVKESTLMDNYHQLLHYLNNPFVSQLKMNDFPTSVNGARHFADVKQLFLLDYSVLIVSAIGSFFFLRTLKQNGQLWRLYRPSMIGMVAPVVIGLLMSVNFDAFFIGFHEVLFSNQDWLFDPNTDPIINVLPEEFFMHCFILFIVLFELLLLASTFVGRYYLKKGTKKASTL